MGYDMEKFMGIYHAHKNMVFKVALHYVKNPEDAEEVMQDVFEELFKIENPVKDEKVRSYLIQACKHTSIDMLRKQKHFATNSVEWEQKGREPIVDSVEDSYMEDCFHQESEEFCACIMSELYQHNREWHRVIHMMYYLEMPGEEIARQLEIDTEVLYSRLYRARKWLQKKFKKQYRRLRRRET